MRYSRTVHDCCSRTLNRATLRGWTVPNRQRITGFSKTHGIGVSVSGTAVPYYINFNAGIRGHLRVRFTAKGKDAWEKDWIRSNVFLGELRHVPGTIDSMVWVEDWETFFFGRDVVLSTEKSDEGYSSLTLLY